MLHSRSPDSEIASQAHINKLLWTDKSLAPKANICCSDTINPPRHWNSPHTILQLNVICPCTVKHVYCQHRIKWKKNKMIFFPEYKMQWSGNVQRMYTRLIWTSVRIFCCCWTNLFHISVRLFEKLILVTINLESRLRCVCTALAGIRLCLHNSKCFF